MYKCLKQNSKNAQKNDSTRFGPKKLTVVEQIKHLAKNLATSFLYQPVETCC